MCWGHTGEPCKNRRTDRDSLPFGGTDSCGPKAPLVKRGSVFPHGKGCDDTCPLKVWGDLVAPLRHVRVPKKSAAAAMWLSLYR